MFHSGILNKLKKAKCKSCCWYKNQLSLHLQIIMRIIKLVLAPWRRGRSIPRSQLNGCNSSRPCKRYSLKEPLICFKVEPQVHPLNPNKQLCLTSGHLQGSLYNNKKALTWFKYRNAWKMDRRREQERKREKKFGNSLEHYFSRWKRTSLLAKDLFWDFAHLPLFRSQLSLENPRHWLSLNSNTFWHTL